MTVTKEKLSYFYDTIPIDLQVSDEQIKQIQSEFPTPSLAPQEGMLNIELEEHGNIVKNIRLLLNDYSVEKASNGNPYLKMSFGNSMGNISAKMWDNNGSVDHTLPILEDYSLFSITAKVEEFPRDSGR